MEENTARVGGRSLKSPPSWYDPRKYDYLDPRSSDDPWGIWQCALDERYGKLLVLDRFRAAYAGLQENPILRKPGDVIRSDPRRVPPWLVVPWGKLPAPRGLEAEMLFGVRTDGPQLQRGDHIATLNQPGFTMWFNMDAPDDVLREGFEHVLHAARGQWPSPLKTRGKGSKNPRITKATLEMWWCRKIVPLFDLDWHFFETGPGFFDPATRPTDYRLGRWVYGEVHQPAREVSKARKLFRQVIAQRAALHHTVRLFALIGRNRSE
jgi:hypothetical protein